MQVHVFVFLSFCPFTIFNVCPLDSEQCVRATSGPPPTPPSSPNKFCMSFLTASGKTGFSYYIFSLLVCFLLAIPNYLRQMLIIMNIGGK